MKRLETRKDGFGGPEARRSERSESVHSMSVKKHEQIV